MSYVQIIQRLPEEFRLTMVELVDAVETNMREQLAVRRQDFDELTAVVRELAEAQRRTEQRMDRLEAAVRELAEAQKRTEQRVEELAEAQRRTEQRMDRLEAAVQRLAEAQARTEQRVDGLEAAVQRLAEAQARTEQRVEELAHAQAQARKDVHAHLSALGARWGLQTEDTFRNAIQAILSEFTDLLVDRFMAYDADGEVFGRPDQVEIDVLIRNGQTILGEIKSSMSKGDVYIFERKVAFYEGRQKKKADRKIIITPMLDPRAQPVVDDLGIQVYSSAYDFGE